MCKKTGLCLLAADYNECGAGGACVAAATACINTPGSFVCPCPAGFSGDGKTAPYGGRGCTGEPGTVLHAGQHVWQTFPLISLACDKPRLC